MAHAKGRGALQRKPTSFYGDNDEAQAMSQHLFSKLDYDGSGYLDTEEMRRARELMLSVSVNSDSARISGDALGGTLSELIKDLDFNHDGQIDDEEWDTFNRSLYEVLGQKQYLRIARSWAANISHSSQERRNSGSAAASSSGVALGAATPLAVAPKPPGGWKKLDGTPVPTQELDSTAEKAWRQNVNSLHDTGTRTESVASFHNPDLAAGLQENLLRSQTDSVGRRSSQDKKVDILTRHATQRSSQEVEIGRRPGSLELEITRPGSVAKARSPTPGSGLMQPPAQRPQSGAEAAPAPRC